MKILEIESESKGIRQQQANATADGISCPPSKKGLLEQNEQILRLLNSLN